MALLVDLAKGTLGLRVAAPLPWSLRSESATDATFVDEDRGVSWRMVFFPNLTLDLRDPATLDRDLRRHTRQLFELAFTPDSDPDALPGADRPRTDDASWDPLVELTGHEVPGGRALSVLHRVHYQAGRETVMGHTLVPVEGGLFEARWRCEARQTGMRETVLLMMRADDDEGFPSQAVYDDPAHDAKFPDHPLTVARAAKRWFEEGTLEVTKPPRDETPSALDALLQSWRAT